MSNHKLSDDEMVAAAMTASKLTPEEFGQLLATATRPVYLDPVLDGKRTTARIRIRELPHGRTLLGEK